MPTAHHRYRPQSAGQPDESQRLARLAALLTANPQLNPTAAIRSLGVDRPADIRRLRTMLRVEQAKHLASTNPPGRVNGTPAAHVAPASQTRDPLSPEPPPVLAAARKTDATTTFIFDWCDMSFGALSAVVEAQSVIAQCWLHVPAVSMTLRAQLALGEVGAAIYARSKKRPLFLH